MAGPRRRWSLMMLRFHSSLAINSIESGGGEGEAFNMRHAIFMPMQPFA